LGAARRAIEVGRQIAHEQEDIEVVAWSHSHSTWRAWVQGDADDALENARQVCELGERSGTPITRTHGWIWLAVAHQMRGDWRRAIRAFERSLEIATEGQTGADISALRLVLGESYQRLREYERAHELAQEGLRSPG
jgi:tetratricopeptide (TPR) repeat protein